MKHGKPPLELVVSRKRKPPRRYEGAPLECSQCKARDLIETFRPTLKEGRVVKGKATGWACPYCQRIVWHN